MNIFQPAFLEQWFRGRNLVGLDIGSSSVKLARLRQAADAWELVSCQSSPLPPNAFVDGHIKGREAVIKCISDLVRLNGLKGADTAIAVNGYSVIAKKISLPEVTRAELDESIQWEAEQYIPFDIKDVNVDVQILNPKAGYGQMDVLLVAAKKEVVNEHVSVASEAGLNPVLVDVGTFAVQNMFELNYGFNRNETIALINIGASMVNINVISGGITAFTCDIAAGGNLLNEEIRKQLNVSWEEAEQFKTGLEGSVSGSAVVREVNKLSDRVSETITTEIQRSLDFFIAASMNAEIARIYLTGGAAQMPALTRSLKKRFEGRVQQVELVNPFRKMVIDTKKFDPDFIQRTTPSLGVAIGLATRRKGDFVTNGYPVHINLLGLDTRKAQRVLFQPTGERSIAFRGKRLGIAWKFSALDSSIKVFFREPPGEISPVK